MKLLNFKANLTNLRELNFKLPDGTYVPSHFHVTEVGEVSKHFIDCGGTVRDEKTISLQLWEAQDYDHRLAPQKLISIIELSERILGIGNHEVEVEYQGDTIQTFAITIDGKDILLQNKHTACLASDHCGIPQEKTKRNLSELQKESSCCAPGGGCC